MCINMCICTYRFSRSSKELCTNTAVHFKKYIYIFDYTRFPNQVIVIWEWEELSSSWVHAIPCTRLTKNNAIVSCKSIYFKNLLHKEEANLKKKKNTDATQNISNLYSFIQFLSTRFCSDISTYLQWLSEIVALFLLPPPSNILLL